MKDAENWPELTEMSNNISGSSTNVRLTPSKEQSSVNYNRDASRSPCNSEESSTSEEGSLKEPNESPAISLNDDEASINETKENANPSGTKEAATSNNKRIKKPKSKPII